MTPQQLNAMKLALEALKWCHGGEPCGTSEAITALEEVLADHAMREVQRLGQEIEQDADSFCDSNCVWIDHHPDCKLAQPEQEPVACRPRLERVKGNDFEEWRKNISPELYAAGDAVLCWVNEGDLCMPPPQRTWVDLPDEEIKRLWIQYRAALPRYLCFAKALLARAKEKNT